uniref:HAT C-terminal dimerisation domain-containing protein n=2 Tax=Dicentrarchus labrax TaxID=13489 RepID=A0A8C4GFL5_DICLA
MLHCLEPRYKIPQCGYMVNTAVRRMHEEVKKVVKTSLSAAQRVALTCDGWTSRATQSYVASQRALKLPAVQRLLGRVRRITNFFRRSAIASHVLKEKQKLLNLEQHKLKTDVVTRWISAHDMLQRFLEQQPAVTAALLSHEVRKNEKDISTVSEADITATEEIVAAMKLMKIATVVMEEEKTPTLSAVAPVHAHLIQELQESPGDSNMIKEIKTAICQDLKKRYLDEQRETLHVCAALDPRFKTLLFLTEDERQTVYDRVTTEAARTQGPFQHGGAGEDVTGEPETDGEEEEDEDAGLEVLGEEDKGSSQGLEEEESFAVLSTSKKRSRDSCGLADLLGQTYTSGAAKKLKTPENQAQEEMGRFKETAPMPITKGANPLNWWREHECEYPLLSKLAKRYLCIPGTSVSSERVFSTAGDIITAQRSALTPEHLDQILFLNKNLKTKEVRYKF